MLIVKPYTNFLFQKANKVSRRLKMYIYGDSGTGKTVTSLHFPNPVVIDMERGTEHYGGIFDFDVLHTTDPDKVKQAVNQLLKDPGNYKTLVIDPMTVFYDQLVEQSLKKKRIRTGNSNEVLAPLDYKPIQTDMKSFISKLVALDMNIILTAHSAVLYSNEPGDFMKAIGTKPEGYKKLPFMMDIVLELSTNKAGKFMAKVIKDRTNKLPTEFEFSYIKMVSYFGIEELERAPVQIKANETLDKINERTVDIMFGGKSVKSAGITGETLELIQTLITDNNLKSSEILEKLQTDYGVDSLLDLKEDEGALLLKDLKTQTTTSTE